jgi:hypothetical protein
MPSLAVVPLRGVKFSDASLSVDPFSRPWTILSLAQADEFQSRYPMNSSVHGNFAVLRERLRPNAYLLVECVKPSAPGYLDAYDYAETILGALCVSSLLAPEHPDGPRQYAPRPIYWTRTIEYCDLPLVIDVDRVRLNGHSGSFAWLSADGGALAKRISTSELFEIVAAAPSVARDMLGDGILGTSWQRRMHAGARALHAAFQAASPGQFIANMATVAELLIKARSRDSWWQRKSRLKVLVGPTYWTRVEEIMAARHDYVHEAKQPTFEYLAFGALGLAVHTWSVLHELCEVRGDIDTVLAEIDSLANADPPKARTTSDLSSAQVASLNERYSSIPRGPLRRRHWINQGLTNVHPNAYYEQFSIFGSVSCPGCGAYLTEPHRVGQTSETNIFICSACNRQIEALLPFAHSR